MLKSRLETWGFVIVIVLIVSIVTSFFNWIGSLDWESTNVLVGTDFSSDIDLDYKISNKSFGEYIVRFQPEDADVFISDKDNVLDGYTKHENYLQSPLVLYCLYTRNKTINFMASPDNNVFRVDFLPILTAMEQNLNWSDIGITSDVANGAVTLYIPNENSPYYDAVVELFYLTLNNGIEPSDNDKVLLKTRVDNILSKCHKISDIYQSINQEYQSPTMEHKVFIGPEYLLARNSYCFSKSYDKSFFPVYFLNTIQLTADVWTKNTDTEPNIGLSFLEEIRTYSTFLIKTGWRVKNQSYTSSLRLYDHVLEQNP